MLQLNNTCVECFTINIVPFITHFACSKVYMVC